MLEIALEAVSDPIWEEKEVGRAVSVLLDRLLLAAAEAPGGASLRNAARSPKLDPRAVLVAGIRDDRAVLEAIAVEIGAAPEAFVPVAELAAMPVLQARGRRLKARCEGWTEGHCPICGAWPALAELRGLERGVRLRCGRCGADWQGSPLSCVFCGNKDHERLRALVPEGTAESRRVEACDVCHGYLKALARMGPMAPEMVQLEDLASVDLDLAAIERGYRRPEPRHG